MIRICGFVRMKQLPHLLSSLNFARHEAKGLAEELRNCRRLNDSMATLVKEQAREIRNLRGSVMARDTALREIVSKETPHAAFAARQMATIARKGLN